MKKKVLIHSIVFSPDGVSTAYLYNDIALGLKQNGFDVVVLTTTPHYNKVEEDLSKQPLKKCWGGLYYKSFFNDILVYHVPQKKFRSTLLRIIGFIYWHLLSFIIGVQLRRVSLILSPSPPLSIGLLSLLIARLKGAKVVYNVQEIYPDFLINQGSLKSGLLISVLKWVEKVVYNYSDAVTTIDKVFYNTVISRFKTAAKLSIIPNFVDTEIYKPLENDSNLDDNIFPSTQVLKVMYAGNIGYAQDWAPLLSVAERLRNLPVEFWVIGEGVLKENLKGEVEKNSLTNIHILPYQPRSKMPSLIAYADVHFIFMNPDMEGEGFPSKVYTIMACKKPLLVISGADTPLYKFLKPNNCAVLIDSKDIDDKGLQLENILRGIIDDSSSLISLGENGYHIIESQYSKKAVIKQYVGLIDGLTN